MKQLEIDTTKSVPVISFIGNCSVEGLEGFNSELQKLNSEGHKNFVFDFSQCKLLNSPAMGELLDVILLVDRDFEGNIVLTGLDKLKETLFTISGIIPIAQEAKTIDDGIALLAGVE